MAGRLVVLAVVLLAAIVCCVFVLRSAPPVPGSGKVLSPEERARRQAEAPTAAKPDPAGYDLVKVKIVVPSLSEFPAPWATSPKGGCAHTKLSQVLGVQVSQGNGVVVFGVAPGQPAAKAGIKPGDRLGEPSACPNAIAPAFDPGKKTRTVDWTIRRPRTASIREQAAKEAAAHPVPPPPWAKASGSPTTPAPTPPGTASPSPASSSSTGSPARTGR